MTLGATQAYGEPSYWDRRYSQEQGPFDWYQKYSALAPLIDLYLSRSHRVLVVGCGNSAFSEGMVDDGYEDIVNIDISSVVIEAMQKKYSNRPQLKFAVRCDILVAWELGSITLTLFVMKMDVRDMSTFRSGSFDAVLDKGTLDSILCGNNSRQNSAMMLEEVGRVLKDKGIYILITYGAPSYRLDLLKSSCKWKIKLHIIEKLVAGVRCDKPKWELTSAVPLQDEARSMEEIIGKNPDVHYVYICTKDESLTHGQIDESVVA